MAVPGLPRAVDAVGVAHAGLYPLNEGMPNIEASVVIAIQINNLCWLKIVWFGEDQQLNTCCAAAVKREVDSVRFNCASEWVRRTYEATKGSALRLKRVTSE